MNVKNIFKTIHLKEVHSLYPYKSLVKDFLRKWSLNIFNDPTIRYQFRNPQHNKTLL